MRKDGGRWSFSSSDYRIIKTWLRQKARFLDSMQKWALRREHRRKRR